MKLPWPELPSAHRPEESAREILDYLVWIVGILSQSGYPAAAERMAWTLRVQRAYSSLFLPPIPNHGDPYPPDVPPPQNPGVWPDIPSSSIPGMTVRHQLKVIGMLARDLRDQVWAHAKPDDVAEWDRRFAVAREMLDHGEGIEVPEEFRTTTSETIIAEAKAQEAAFRDHAKKRAQRLVRLKAQARKAAKERSDQAKVAAQEEAAAQKAKAAPKKAAPEEVAPEKTKAAPKAKKAAPRKAAPKAKRAAPKKAKAAPKAKKAAPRKAAPRKTKAAPKKAAPKAKKAAPRKATPKKTKAAPKKTKAAPKKAAPKKAAPKAKK